MGEGEGEGLPPPVTVRTGVAGATIVAAHYVCVHLAVRLAGVQNVD